VSVTDKRLVCALFASLRLNDLLRGPAASWQRDDAQIEPFARVKRDSVAVPRAHHTRVPAHLFDVTRKQRPAVVVAGVVQSVEISAVIPHGNVANSSNFNQVSLSWWKFGKG
jgi:hypothetical protein